MFPDLRVGSIVHTVEFIIGMVWVGAVEGGGGARERVLITEHLAENGTIKILHTLMVNPFM